MNKPMWCHEDLWKQNLVDVITQCSVNTWKKRGDKLVKIETQLQRSLLTIRSAKSHFNDCDQWMKCGDMNTQVTIMHWWHVDPQETVW